MLVKLKEINKVAIKKQNQNNNNNKKKPQNT